MNITNFLAHKPASYRYGFYVFTAFICFFSLIFVANYFLVNIALRTHKGVISENAYKEGLDYNQTIAKFNKQQDLQWHIIPRITNNMIQVKAFDKDKQPLAQADIYAFITRSDTDKMDAKIKLTPTKSGVYFSEFSFPKKGKWTIYFTIKQQQDSYQTHHTFIAQ